VSHVTPDAIEIVSQLIGLRQLFLNGALIDCRPLARLRNLNTLTIIADSVANTDSLAPLSDLQALGLGHLTTPPDLNQVAKVCGLRELGLSAATWARLRVPTLAPLAALHRLERFGMIGCRVDDGLLRPLATLSELRDITLPNSFSLAEFAYLAAARPDLRGPSRSPFFAKAHLTDWTNYACCERCHCYAYALTLGRPSRRLCPHCDSARIASHVRRWTALVEKAHAALNSDPPIPLDFGDLHPIDEWTPGARPLTPTESQILTLVQESWGPHNDGSVVVFSAAGDAGLVVRDQGGDPIMCLILTTVAEALEAKRVTLQAARRYVRGPQPPP
jgi:hypothetical protein